MANSNEFSSWLKELTENSFSIPPRDFDPKSETFEEWTQSMADLANKILAFQIYEDFGLLQKGLDTRWEKVRLIPGLSVLGAISPEYADFKLLQAIETTDASKTAIRETLKIAQTTPEKMDLLKDFDVDEVRGAENLLKLSFPPSTKISAATAEPVILSQTITR